MLARLPEVSREADVALTSGNGTPFTSSRSSQTLALLGTTHRCAAYPHSGGNGYTERLPRTMQDDEFCMAEYLREEEAPTSIARRLMEHHHDWLLCRIEDRTSRGASWPLQVY